MIDVDNLNSLIDSGIVKNAERNALIKLRNKTLTPQKLRKVAFDTRRINQETELNPRRGLQNYNRSDAFISLALSNKLQNLNILKNVLNDIKNSYEKEVGWNDSNARILLSHLEKALRTNIDDGDYTDSQPGVGSLSYLEELLFVRYRLDLNKLNETDSDKLKEIILSKDEELSDMNVVDDHKVISSKDVGTMNYDQLLNTLFSGVKATQENKKVKRKITIEIEDSIDDEEDQ